MEKALRYELNQIPEITNKIYPTNAPEGKESPYLVYILSRYEQTKTLTEIKNNIESSYLLNVLASSYAQMKELTKKVKEKVLTFYQRNIGTEGIFIADLTVNNISETYESELGMYRGIVDITFWYKEE
ncbi:hypothetical protein RI196_09975 [Aeribacillus composti]|uniref:DUF3168 domain-containing protein n=1 Tax=Aeribacillus composti TaxID=1868734 RepID=A0ABY9W6I6_9BACI|nr:hypothetical protein [Aeribacillus composti]WNF31638.1 hypothetical protein RI196_09975 [Aeribacillus composti]